MIGVSDYVWKRVEVVCVRRRRDWRVSPVTWVRRGVGRGPVSSARFQVHAIKALMQPVDGWRELTGGWWLGSSVLCHVVAHVGRSIGWVY